MSIRRVLGILALAIMNSGCNRVPAEVNDLIFAKSQFAEPIKVEPGQDDGAAALTNAQLNANRQSFLPRIVLATQYDRFDKVMLSFLVEEHYSSVTCVQMQFAIKSSACYLVHDSSIAELKRVGHRQLDRTTYSNKYETSVLGTPVTVAALTFKYKIITDRKGFPTIDGMFDGNGKAVLNPDTGKWQLDQLSLSDTAGDSYAAWIHSRYRPYVLPAERSGESKPQSAEAHQPAAEAPRSSPSNTIEPGSARASALAAAEPEKRRQQQVYLKELNDLWKQTGANFHGAGHDAMKRYLEDGGDPNVRIGGYYSLLNVAARSGYKDVVESLLARGVDINSGSSGNSVGSRIEL